PSTTTPTPASPTITPTPAPSTATGVTGAPASTPARATTSLPIPVVSTGAFPTTPGALPSNTTLESSSVVTPSSPPLMSTTLVVPTTHAPTRDTTCFTQPAPSPPPAPLPLCPCPTPGLAVPVLRSRAGEDGLQGGHWVLSHCCLLHWVLYLASLALLVLTVLALAGWLAWMCLVGRPFWHRSLQTREVQYLLLRESTGSPLMHLGSSKSHLQRTTFCTIKEVELYPQVTYCTIKDLGIQCSPPASSNFCTTKELWIHHSPLNASFKSFSTKPMATNLGSLRTPSAYSLDRGIKAIGDVRVKYAGNTL
ncbi:PREDICTED: platelet glycoprotein Ib alpha chain-like, partial [Nestor notabilis]|uniref:platelet glycoprotein Ib alpha chain-like n=1 Tax=Nestor notabilis TaxID=176057 RepID=UPI000523459B